MLQIAELIGSSTPIHQNGVKTALPGASAGAAASATLTTRLHLNKGINYHAHPPKNV